MHADGAADAAEAADAHTRESLQTASAKDAAAPAESLPRIAPGDNVQIESASIMFHLPHVGQQPALGDCQPLHHAGSATGAKQRLHQVEIQKRGTGIVIWAGKLPNQRIGQADHEFAACRREFFQPESVGWIGRTNRQNARTAGFPRPVRTFGRVENR